MRLKQVGGWLAWKPRAAKKSDPAMSQTFVIKPFIVSIRLALCGCFRLNKVGAGLW